jgi:hypothetical protein
VSAATTDSIDTSTTFSVGTDLPRSELNNADDYTGQMLLKAPFMLEIPKKKKRKSKWLEKQIRKKGWR